MTWVRVLFVALCALLLGPAPGAHADCNNPAAPEGVMLYNTNQNVPQYCDGAAWTRLAPPTLGLPETGLIGYWKLDESGNVSTAVDSAGTNNGALTSFPADPSANWVAGQLGNALDFDGSNDNVNAGNTTTLDNLPQMTVSAWIRPDSAGDNTRGAIVNNAQGGANDPTTGWNFRITSGFSLEFAVDYNTTNFERESSNGLVSTGVWQHVAFTWTGGAAATTARIYINGVETTYKSPVNGSASRVDDSAATLRIGNTPDNTSTFEGRIDDVRIYNRALSAEEIARCCAAMPGMAEGPKNLSIAGSVTNAQLDGAAGVAIKGNYAYVGNQNADRLTVVDISNPASPSIVGSVTGVELDHATNIAISGNYAFVSCYASSRMTVVDISNPASPTIVGSITDAQITNPSSVVVSGNFAYVTAESVNRLTVVDVSNPAAPLIVSSIQDAWLSAPQRVTVKENYAYVTASNADRLNIVDISNPVAPSIVGSVTHANLDSANDAMINGGYAYVATSGNRLTVVDISNPAAPSVVGSVSDAQIGQTWGRIVLLGDYVYIPARTANRLTVVDIKNPAAPTVVSSIQDNTLLQTPRGVAVQGGYAYVGVNDGDRLTAINLHWNCNDPPGVEGELLYSADERAPMYCDGDQWVALGQDALSRGLVGHWKLDEASGTLGDSSDNGNTGTQSGGIGYSSAGMIGTALNFDGNNDYAETGNMPDWDTTKSYTVSLWARADRHGDPASDCGDDRALLFAKWGNPTAIDSIQFKWNGTAAAWDPEKIVFAHKDQSPGGYSEVTTSGTFNLGQWYLLTAIHDTAARELRLYVDGQLDATFDISANPLVSVSGLARIGGTTPHCSTGNFDGNIDDVRIYNRALPAAEVAALYKHGLQDDGLIAHWPLNEDGGAIATDTAGGNIGYASGGVVFGSAGKIGLAAQFDGTDDYVDAGSDDSIANISNAVTVAAWVKPPNGVSGAIVSNSRDCCGTYNGFQLDRDSSNRFAFTVWNSTDRLALSPPFLSAGGWYHVAGTFDGSTVRIFVNGNLENSAPYAGTIGVPASSSLKIGRMGAISAWPFNGNIDDVRIYNRALTANEIAEIHAAGAAGLAAQDCMNPNGAEGAIIYNLNENAPQYCDGARWVKMGGP